MAALTLRAAKGSPLTNTEMDTNLSNLNSDIATRTTSTYVDNGLALKANIDPGANGTIDFGTVTNKYRYIYATTLIGNLAASYITGSFGTVTATTSFSGPGIGLTGTASSLTAGYANAAATNTNFPVLGTASNTLYIRDDTSYNFVTVNYSPWLELQTRDATNNISGYSVRVKPDLSLGWYTKSAGTYTERVNFAANGAATFYYGLNVSGTTSLGEVISNSISIIGNLTITGNATATTFISSSDSRLKSDLVRITSALDKIDQLTGYTYTRISTGARETGLIAQDIVKVLPEAVNDKDTYQHVAYGNMMGLIVEAIKELRYEIAQIKSSIK